ncbi:hypothetical protein MAR_008112 [Mya arenaria]|uniref:Synaptotagmin n=1 Tax=Mya arenaria TaxID=6604 RepID=A0ABY7DWZ3_MYAAR|nr:hypothetical protein MAR_008112 [Mya arenaria]
MDANNLKQSIKITEAKSIREDYRQTFVPMVAKLYVVIPLSTLLGICVALFLCLFCLRCWKHWIPKLRYKIQAKISPDDEIKVPHSKEADLKGPKSVDSAV